MSPSAEIANVRALAINAGMAQTIDPSVKAAIAARFSAVREARGFKNIHLASKASGITYSVLDRVENADYYPSVETLVKASRTYDVPVEFLIEGVTGRVDPELLAKLDLKRD